MATHRNLSASRRGSTLLMATGVITLATVGVFMSLGAVQSESSLQGDERRSRIAFFAAEAALAEGRERMRILVGSDPTYTAAIGSLGAFVSETGLPANQMFDVLPWTSYALDSGGAELAVAASELVARDGKRYALNAQRNVRYRVFVYDDEDGDGSITADSNKLVWLVAVGEVSSEVPGAMPVRSVVRALIRTTAGVPTSPGYGAQKGQGSDKTFTNNDSNAIQFGNNTF
jgi:hypothetical protein